MIFSLDSEALFGYTSPKKNFTEIIALKGAENLLLFRNIFKKEKGAENLHLFELYYGKTIRRGHDGQRRTASCCKWKAYFGATFQRGSRCILCCASIAGSKYVYEKAG